jgi:hypothetical protein
LRLESATGVPASLWSNLEARYREHLARLRRLDELNAHTAWARQFPVKFLRDSGLIPADAKGSDLVGRLCAFFGVTSPNSWDEQYSKMKVAFRTSAKLLPDRFATATWLRIGVLQAQRIQTNKFDNAGFRRAVQAIRRLTDTVPETFMSEVTEYCASAGVAFVLAPAPTGCRASGAAMWLRDDKAMILLSVRYRTDDHFWFSFFHEAGHVVQADRKTVFLDGDGSKRETDPSEMAANRFASETLIPANRARELPTLNTKTAVRAFADGIGIAPGIVVGQLQHRNLVPYSQMNDLKRRFQWVRGA